MSYEAVIEKVKKSPADHLDEISDYIDFIIYKFGKEEDKDKTAAEKFLELSWIDDRSAEQIIDDIYNSRKNSARFEA